MTAYFLLLRIFPFSWVEAGWLRVCLFLSARQWPDVRRRMTGWEGKAGGVFLSRGFQLLVFRFVVFLSSSFTYGSVMHHEVVELRFIPWIRNYVSSAHQFFFTFSTHRNSKQQSAERETSSVAAFHSNPFLPHLQPPQKAN